MSYQKTIEETLKNLKLDIFEADIIYNKFFNKIPEITYYKSLDRMHKKGLIFRITKGLYSFHELNDDELINYFTKNKNGLVVGSDLFNKVGKSLNSKKIYSKVINTSSKRINDIKLYKYDLTFNKDVIKTIEILEIIENYQKINDINKDNLSQMILEFINIYNDKCTKYVLENIKYKKNTIASLKEILDYYNIDNNLSIYLKTISKYRVDFINYLI